LNISLDHAICYDCETLPNVFTLNAQGLHSDFNSTWEISEFRDDRFYLFQWFDHLYRNQIPMLGFNNVYFDYAVIHWLKNNPNATVAQIYEFAMNIINSQNRFGNTIWDRDRFAPQIDLFKIYHFDNKAKTTSLKALEINMRSEKVIESDLIGKRVTPQQIDGELIPYNKHDVAETKKFALNSLSAINFRIGLMSEFGVEVLNWNDTKIGEKILEKKIGQEICYYQDENGRKQKRQSPRNRVALSEIIFPYISFQNPEFARVLAYLKTQVLTPEEIIDTEGNVNLGDTIKTKGVFAGLKAHVGGVDFHFGTGGIHASVTAQHVKAGNGVIMRDIDVAGLYPSIGIVNGLYPEHLGEPFVKAYASLPAERKEWQKKKGKKCPEANSLKLAGNGAYGKSNDKFSVLYDPKYTMTITVNGQLMLAMLAERLITVPTLQLIQANTDGITYLIREEYEPFAKQICRDWEALTRLTLEDANYSDMWIRDVNNYIARSLDGTLKQKGAYWHPEAGARYFESISEAQPPAWHKDLGNLVSIKAAVAAMVHGVNPETFIRAHTDKFDFMCRVKVGRADTLTLAGREIQRTSRYYVARQGGVMVKTSHPAEGNRLGDFKRASKITDLEFQRVTQEIGPGVWDARIHTKNKSRYEMRETAIQAGWQLALCNDANDFSFDNLNYQWYLNEALKLIVR